MDAGKVAAHHQLEDQSGVAAIVLLPAMSAAANLGSMTEPDFAVQCFQHFFEPGGVTTALKTYDDLAQAAEVSKESTHCSPLFGVLMRQFQLFKFTIFSCQITECLFASV